MPDGRQAASTHPFLLSIAELDIDLPAVANAFRRRDVRLRTSYFVARIAREPKRGAAARKRNPGSASTSTSIPPCEAQAGLHKKIPGGFPPGIVEFVPRSDDQGRQSLCIRIVNVQLLWFATVVAPAVGQSNGCRKSTPRSEVVPLCSF